MSVTSSAGTASNSGNTVTATFSSLAGNASATITITATIDKTVAPGTYLANRASLSTNQPDPNPSNNVTALATQVLPTPAQLLNISTRMRVLTGEQVLIAGFIITGTDPKKVIMRGMGPSLNGVGVTLADPTLELHQGSTTVATNDNWKINDQTQQSQEADIRATTIPPTNDLESALVATLNPGNYTAIVRGKNNTTGVALVEVYALQ